MLIDILFGVIIVLVLVIIWLVATIGNFINDVVKGFRK